MVSHGNKHVLKISNVSLSQKGKYILEASNLNGHLVCEFELDVMSKFLRIFALIQNRNSFYTWGGN